MEVLSDRIEIRGLRTFGRHGVLAAERERGQVFVIDLTLELDLTRAVHTDQLSDTVDYGRLSQQVADAVEGTRFDLIEALAGHLADLVLRETPVLAVTVRVGKPEAPVPVAFDDVGVMLRRTRAPLGSEESR